MNPPSGPRIAQRAAVVDERRRRGVRRAVRVHEQFLHLAQVGLERVEEASGLQVFGGCAAVVSVIG